jgi:hypothetical protein
VICARHNRQPVGIARDTLSPTSYRLDVSITRAHVPSFSAEGQFKEGELQFTASRGSTFTFTLMGEGEIEAAGPARDLHGDGRVRVIRSRYAREDPVAALEHAGRRPRRALRPLWAARLHALDPAP